MYCAIRMLSVFPRLKLVFFSLFRPPGLVFSLPTAADGTLRLCGRFCPFFSAQAPRLLYFNYQSAHNIILCSSSCAALCRLAPSFIRVQRICNVCDQEGLHRQR
ncbi:hypothetical protein B484DRAFT_123652 [Ochromonadaceae sp. CCMP2298]|nr:hypothetical protein B484DRAFT_123652 [Ochromonadaceae sp. CCMP2298]